MEAEPKRHCTRFLCRSSSTMPFYSPGNTFLLKMTPVATVQARSFPQPSPSVRAIPQPLFLIRKSPNGGLEMRPNCRPVISRTSRGRRPPRPGSAEGGAWLTLHSDPPQGSADYSVGLPDMAVSQEMWSVPISCLKVRESWLTSSDKQHKRRLVRKAHGS